MKDREGCGYCGKWADKKKEWIHSLPAELAVGKLTLTHNQVKLCKGN